MISQSKDAYVNGLTEDDMYRILTEPVANLIRQQIELMKTEVGASVKSSRMG